MSLPKISVPSFEIELFSTNKKIEVRPFLVKEEKLLLIALESNNTNEILKTVKKTIQDCIITPNINIKDLSYIDIEYLFLKIRNSSLGEKITVVITCPETNKKFDAEVDLSDIHIEKNLENIFNIEVSPSVGILMKYPSFDSMENFYNKNISSETKFNMLINCVDTIYDNDSVYSSKDYSAEEITNFVNNLPKSLLTKINIFYETLPKIYFSSNIISPYTQKMVKVRMDNFLDFFVLDFLGNH